MSVPKLGGGGGVSVCDAVVHPVISVYVHGDITNLLILKVLVF